MSAVWDSDYLWREAHGAKLASLFGLDQVESQGNESFKFIAPKQPKKTPTMLAMPIQKAVPPPETPAILLASAVHAFHFVNRQYVKQGKLGVAILGNHATKEYKVMLYGSQQKQFTSARIHREFVLTVQPGNYSTFYDDQRQIWSLKFDSEKAGIDFFKEVCLARWNSGAHTDTLVIQDLLQGEGQAVEAGDTVEVTFTGWLLQDHTIGQKFVSNTGKDKLQRVRLGAGKSPKGWEEGLLGMQKGGRRLLIVPPSMGHGSIGIPNSVPPGSTLMIDVEIHQVKLSKDSDCPNGGSTHTVSPDPEVDRCSLSNTNQSAIFDHGDPASWVKSGPVNDHPKHSDAVKARLNSHIAKMGVLLLPFLKDTTQAQTEPSDFKTEDVEESRPILTKAPPADCPSLSSSQSIEMDSTATSCTVSNKPSADHQPEATADSLQQVHVSSNGDLQLLPTSQTEPSTLLLPHQHQLYTANDINSFLMTETQQKTEIRLSVGRVAEKVEQLASKINEIKRQGPSSSFSLSTMSQDTDTILSNLQKMTQENISLKQEIVEKDLRLEEQNHKIEKLLEQNHGRHSEHSDSLWEQKIHALKSSTEHTYARLQAEREKVLLAEKLESSNSLVCELQQEAGRLQQRVAELQTNLGTALQESQNRGTLISTMETQMEELKNEGEHFQQQLKAERRNCRRMEITVKNLKEEIQDLKTEKENLEQTLLDRKKRFQKDHEHFVMVLEEQRRSNDLEKQQAHEQVGQAKACNETHTRQQTDLELMWQERCDAALEQQKRTLDVVLTRLQEQFVAIQKKATRKKQQDNEQVNVKLKQVMNRLFHSLRAEFDMQESYTGVSVLKILLNTIKYVTMQAFEEPNEEKEEEADDDDDDDDENDE